jgi:uncharacterized surface protein with fasciclin (FAS1) repeats
MKLKKILYHFRFLPLVFAALVMLACEKDFTPFVADIETNSIADILKENEKEYGYFIRLAEKGGLMDALDSYNPHGNGYTLFLPDNSAFEKFFTGNSTYKNIDDLLGDTGYARALVRYHVLNTQIRSNDFPFGALPDTTLTGDLLTVGFNTTPDTTYYLINNTAAVKTMNIPARNGYVHVLEDVLTPVTFTGIEWLEANPGYSILTEAFRITGIKNKMGLTTETPEGSIVANNYTVLAEADSIFHKKGIFSLEDLIQEVSPNDNNYTAEENPLYQFAAYHIIEGVYFLDGFENTKNYNTFGALPIRIGAGARLRINNDPKFHVLDTVITGTDTTYINYLEPIYNAANIITLNGAIHPINHVLFVYRPQLSSIRFEFYDDPVINRLRNTSNIHVFNDQTPLTQISWTGPEEIIYYKTTGSESASNKDYLQIEGNFAIHYRIPRVVPGQYQVTLRANSSRTANAIVEVFIDGKKTGGNVNLFSGGNPYRVVTLGSVNFSVYESHVITVRSVLPGRFTWDWTEFIPN